MKQTMNTIVKLVVFLGISSIGLCAEPFAKGPYLGQAPPGSTAQVFAPGLICNIGQRQWESHGHSGNPMGTSLRMATPFALCEAEVFLSQKTQTRVGQRLNV
jgi:hypothetical protein